MMTVAERARRNKNVYTINSITRVKNCIDDRIIEEYTKQFSPEYALRVARSVLKYKGVHNNRVIYDECYSDAGILYSIQYIDVLIRNIHTWKTISNL